MSDSRVGRVAVGGIVAGSLLWIQVLLPPTAHAGLPAMGIALPPSEREPHAPDDPTPQGPVSTVTVALASSSMVSAPVKINWIVPG
jgi:hypothetical protein